MPALPVVCRLGFPYSAASVDLTLASDVTRAGPFRRELDELQLDDHELGSLQSFGSASAHSDSDKVSQRRRPTPGSLGARGFPAGEMQPHCRSVRGTEARPMPAQNVARLLAAY